MVTCFRFVLLTLVVLIAFENAGEASKRRRSRKRAGPPPTHPVLLWSRTLKDGTDPEQRKIAAFKMSQYSQTIFQEEAISTLLKCVKDSDVEIRVLCTKAMGRAGMQSRNEGIRKALLELYKEDPAIRNTVVRVFVVRKDSSSQVQDVLLDSLKKTTEIEDAMALLKYFEAYGNGSNYFVEVLTQTYHKFNNTKLQGAVISALSAKSEGQSNVVSLLVECTESSDTPLVLTCLSGLQQQAKKDDRVWTAVEKTIESDDPDVLVSTLDVISSLPEKPNEKIAKRLMDLISHLEDEDTQEKAILGLGVCGNGSQETVDVLLPLLEKKSTPEGVRVVASLVLGKQASLLPEKPKAALSTCAKEENSQSLRTACQLGLKDLESRAGKAAQAPSARATATEKP